MRFEVSTDYLDITATKLAATAHSGPKTIPSFGGPYADGTTISHAAIPALADWSDYLYEIEQSLIHASTFLTTCSKAYQTAESQVEDAIQKLTETLK